MSLILRVLKVLLNARYDSLRDDPNSSVVEFNETRDLYLELNDYMAKRGIK